MSGSDSHNRTEGRLNSCKRGLIPLNFDQSFSTERRHIMETKDIVEFGPFRADVRRRILTRGSEPVSLPSKALDVLLALVGRAGQTVSKDELIKEVWPDTFVEEGNLTQMVFLLRKALGESDGGQPLIVTVPRQGYRFVGELTSPATEEIPDRGSTDRQPAAAAVTPGPKNIWWIGAVIAIGSSLGGWAVARYYFRQSAIVPHAVRYTIAPPDKTSYRVGRVSPDGRSLALLAVDTSGNGRLWLRKLDALDALALTPAEFWPFWSPDSRFIAFAQDGKLKKIDVSGGVPQTICSASLVIGGTWNRDGTILFSDGEVILQVSAKGGESKPLTRLDASRSETTHHFPAFLPDGRHFLLYCAQRKERKRGHLPGIARFARRSDPPSRRHFQCRIRSCIGAGLGLSVVRQGPSADGTAVRFGSSTTERRSIPRY